MNHLQTWGSDRYRTLPTTGIEVDVTCRDKRTGDLDRVSLLAPLESPRVLYHHPVAGSRPINIIMPLKGRPDNLQVVHKEPLRYSKVPLLRKETQ